MPAAAHRGNAHLDSAGPKETVAVVVTLHNRKELTQDEEISYRHLVQYLGKYPKFMVAAKSLDVEYPGFEVRKFPDRFFGSRIANSRLLLSPAFYRAFRDYEYILVYQLDALVFSDQLLEWCNRGVDYIGAPWIHCPELYWLETPHVGNGGFSLRRVASFLRVLESDRHAIDPDLYSQNRPWYQKLLNLPRKYLMRFHAFNDVKWVRSRWRRPPHEDRFWSEQAVTYDPEFKVASLELGLRFAFEVAPRRCFELNGGHLPFGCHGWARYDPAFWEPYLLR